LRAKKKCDSKKYTKSKIKSSKKSKLKTYDLCHLSLSPKNFDKLHKVNIHVKKKNIIKNLQKRSLSNFTFYTALIVFIISIFDALFFVVI